MTCPCIVPKPNRCIVTDAAVFADVRNLRKEVDTSLADGEYTVQLTESGSAITAAGEKGFFYAKQTLRQLNAAYGDKIPCMVVQDAPAFVHRGFMLDSVRHMQSIDEIKTLIDAAAVFKFNVFHWHLSDDQGFRFESETFPELIEQSSVRPSSDFGDVHDSNPYGGYYTKAQMREIVQYCHDRFITVIPEFDLPGHTSAVLHAKPELSCTGEAVKIKTCGGVFPDILCGGKDEVYDFLYALLDEVCDVFPDEYIHIGGDEAPKKHWQTCVHCQKKMEELHFTDEEQLQGYMTCRMAEHLGKKGRKVICWNETLASDVLPQELIIQNWMDRKKQCTPFANKGGKVIYSDYYHYYTDYPYTMTPVKKTYSADPFAQDLFPAAYQNIVGVETPIWTEHVRDFSRLCYMTWPRFAAVSETGWTKKENKDYNDFKRRMIALLPLLSEIGIQAAPPEDWDPNPVKRLFGTATFFMHTVNKEMIVNFLKGNKD